MQYGPQWKISVLLWEECDAADPPRLRLMTVSVTSPLFRVVSERVEELSSTYHLLATATYQVLAQSDVWERFECRRRELILADRVYWGDLFQIDLFRNLSDCLQLDRRRDLYSVMDPVTATLMFGSADLDGPSTTESEV